MELITIQKYIQFIIENVSVYIEHVEEFLKRDELRIIYDKYSEYNSFGYKYVNQYNKQLHLNPDSLNEYIENPPFKNNLQYFSIAMEDPKLNSSKNMLLLKLPYML